MLLVGCQGKSLVEKENLKIVVTSDIHYFLKDYYKDCEWFEESMLYGDGKMVTNADEIMEAFITKVKEIKPDLVIVTGDLSFNGEKGSHQGLANYLKKVTDNDIPVAVINGNHDVDTLNPKGYGKDDYFEVEKTNAKVFKEVYKDLGYNLSTSEHKESLSYRIDINDKYSLLMMDTNAHELTGGNFAMGGNFPDSTMKWMKEQLTSIQKDKKTPLIAMHHNLTDHNELLNNGYTIKNNKEIADLFKSYQVPFVLSGHVHCQNIQEINGIYDIASSSLLDAPLQYGVIDINKESINYHNESLTISKDSNEYFDLVSSTHFEEGFSKIKDESIRQQMKEVLVKANRYYFTGNMHEHIEELKNMPGYQYYNQPIAKDVEFYKTYLESMMKDTKNHNQLTIQVK